MTECGHSQVTNQTPYITFGVDSGKRGFRDHVTLLPADFHVAQSEKANARMLIRQGLADVKTLLSAGSGRRPWTSHHHALQGWKSLALPRHIVACALAIGNRRRFNPSQPRPAGNFHSASKPHHTI